MKRFELRHLEKQSLSYKDVRLSYQPKIPEDSERKLPKVKKNYELLDGSEYFFKCMQDKTVRDEFIINRRKTSNKTKKEKLFSDLNKERGKRANKDNDPWIYAKLRKCIRFMITVSCVIEKYSIL